MYSYRPYKNPRTGRCKAIVELGRDEHEARECLTAPAWGREKEAEDGWSRT
jgi:hypothetical protein